MLRRSRLAPPPRAKSLAGRTVRVARALLSAGAMEKKLFASLFVFLVAASPALAEETQRPIVLTQKGHHAPGSDELSAQLGFQASLGGTTPGGFKLFLDYSHRLDRLVWLNFKFNPTFGVGDEDDICYDRFGNPYDCSYGFPGQGYAIDIMAGVKLKWMLRNHLQPYASIDGGIVPIFARPNGDNGAALALHTGGGLKYFVTRAIGLGAEADFTFGPAFYQGHNEFYRAFNFALGAEFLL